MARKHREKLITFKCRNDGGTLKQFLGSQATQRPARTQETQGNRSESASYTDAVNTGKTEACSLR